LGAEWQGEEDVELRDLRERIDGIDKQVIELLNERAKVAREIGQRKKKANAKYYAPERENVIFRRLRELNTGPMPDDGIEIIYREIISATRSLEKELTIAYLGPQATFTHLASRHMFGSSARFVPVRSIPGVFTEVERGRADYGVVPIENTTGGVVHETLDAFMESALQVSNEVMLEISHCLLSNTPFNEITDVYSMEQALYQCRHWIEGNLPEARLHNTHSTARAAELAVETHGAAAIGCEFAGGVYGLKVLVAKIEDYPDNYTRFLVVSNESPGASGDDKTSVMFIVKDRVGALYDMLRPFAENGISLSKIESRPSRRKPWEYVFFVDAGGHRDDPEVAAALEEVESNCVFMKMLGSYPAARIGHKPSKSPVPSDPDED